MNSSSRPDARAQLLERCQQQRNDMIAMTATALALAPRARSWARTTRTLMRLLRLLAARPRATPERTHP